MKFKIKQRFSSHVLTVGEELLSSPYCELISHNYNLPQIKHVSESATGLSSGTLFYFDIVTKNQSTAVKTRDTVLYLNANLLKLSIAQQLKIEEMIKSKKDFYYYHETQFDFNFPGNLVRKFNHLEILKSSDLSHWTIANPFPQSSLLQSTMFNVMLSLGASLDLPVASCDLNLIDEIEMSFQHSVQIFKSREL
jgi:hypothetical protein